MSTRGGRRQCPNLKNTMHASLIYVFSSMTIGRIFENGLTAFIHCGSHISHNIGEHIFRIRPKLDHPERLHHSLQTIKIHSFENSVYSNAIWSFLDHLQDWQVCLVHDLKCIRIVVP